MPDLSNWTLAYYAGSLSLFPTTNTFEGWSIDRDSVRYTKSSLQSDKFSFDQLVAFDSEPSFPVVAPTTAVPVCGMIAVYQGGTCVFLGKVVSAVRTGDPGTERISYVAEGLWWFLDSVTYLQSWASPTSSSQPPGGTNPLVAFRKSVAILMQDPFGRAITTAEVVSEVLLWALAYGAPFKLGAIWPGMKLNYSEVRDRKCSEVIRDLLKWQPEVTSYFSYSDFPVTFPSLNLVGRAQSETISRTMGAKPVVSIQSNPRNDLVVPGVRVIYESQNSIDDYVWATGAVDSAGDDTFGTIYLTVQLSGSSESYQRQFVGTLPPGQSSLDWWIKKAGWLADCTGPDGTGKPIISAGAITPNAQFELVSGAVPSWKQTSFWDVVASAKVDFAYTDSNGGKVVKYGYPLKGSFVGTDLTNGIYVRLVSDTEAEAIPVGVARAVYNSLGAGGSLFVQWQGRMVLASEEIDSTFHPGQLLNILGGRLDWETMAAQIQVVEHDIGRGSTNVIFGPPRHLYPQDLVELARMNRQRIRSFRLQERVDAQVRTSGSSVGALATPKPGADSSPDGGTRSVSYRDPVTENEVTLSTLVKDMPAGAPTGLKIKAREVGFCDGTSTKKMIVLGSEPYE